LIWPDVECGYDSRLRLITQKIQEPRRYALPLISANKRVHNAYSRWRSSPNCVGERVPVRDLSDPIGLPRNPA
jgi:hypothetical protein